jgi:hypothetical protein
LAQMPPASISWRTTHRRLRMTYSRPRRKALNRSHQPSRRFRRRAPSPPLILR